MLVLHMPQHSASWLNAVRIYSGLWHSNAGKEVSVSMEYERQVGGAPAAADSAPAPPAAAAVQPQRTMSFGTVTLQTTDPKTGAARDANVAEMLLVRGLAAVVRHRTCALSAAPIVAARLSIACMGVSTRLSLGHRHISQVHPPSRLSCCVLRTLHRCCASEFSTCKFDLEK